MSYFKYSVFGLLMLASMLAEATTTTSFATDVANPSSILINSGIGSSYDETGAAVVRTGIGGFTDTWTLNLDAGKTATIAFTNNPFLNFFQINGLQVNSSGSLSFTTSTAGPTVFTVTGIGNGTQGGSYSVGTTVVPVPAAMWLMGSALVGLISFSRRKSEVAG